MKKIEFTKLARRTTDNAKYEVLGDFMPPSRGRYDTRHGCPNYWINSIPIYPGNITDNEFIWKYRILVILAFLKDLTHDLPRGWESPKHTRLHWISRIKASTMNQSVKNYLIGVINQWHSDGIKYGLKYMNLRIDAIESLLEFPRLTKEESE